VNEGGKPVNQRPPRWDSYPLPDKFSTPQWDTGPVLLAIGAGLNWLNAVAWLLFWLTLDGRFWQGGVLVLGFALVASSCTIGLYLVRSGRLSHLPSVASILLLAFPTFWLFILLVGPGG
jgi:hypothetical protein